MNEICSEAGRSNNYALISGVGRIDMGEAINITTEYITLGQFLKEAGIIDTGGMAKWFLSEFAVEVNGEEEARRGRKLYPGDVVEVEENGSFTIGTGEG
jgi:S4 domain protein YaaA